MKEITKEKLFGKIDVKTISQNSDFKEIILHIMPLLKNGTTPKKQTILNILEDIAERVEKDCWRLKHNGQGELLF